MLTDNRLNSHQTRLDTGTRSLCKDQTWDTIRVNLLDFDAECACIKDEVSGSRQINSTTHRITRFCSLIQGQALYVRVCKCFKNASSEISSSASHIQHQIPPLTQLTGKYCEGFCLYMGVVPEPMTFSLYVSTHLSGTPCSVLAMDTV